MSDFADFLERLLSGQSIVFERRPTPSRRDQRAAEPVLEEKYAEYALHIAGPPIPFQAHIALQAGALVWRACWLTISPQDFSRYQDRLKLDRGPRSPEDHLSADLVLRFLPQVYRRARANPLANPLAESLCQLLRQWPLSGVLANIPEAPTGDLEFGGHPGLMLLYAERLVHQVRPNWLPQGRALEYVEWVLEERGERLPAATDEEEPGGNGRDRR